MKNNLIKFITGFLLFVLVNFDSFKNLDFKSDQLTFQLGALSGSLIFCLILTFGIPKIYSKIKNNEHIEPNDIFEDVVNENKKL
ncbi:MAG: hypothetical protein ACRCXZ_00205 [Patescibacteria group bacterium]